MELLHCGKTRCPVVEAVTQNVTVALLKCPNLQIAETPIRKGEIECSVLITKKTLWQPEVVYMRSVHRPSSVT